MLRYKIVDEGMGVTGRDYAFTHHKIQEVVYAAIPRRRRQQAHAQAGEAMETCFRTQLDRVAGELAHHFLRAQQPGKAATYLRQAGDLAASQFANTDAVAYFCQALTLVSEEDLETRYDLLLAREKVYDVLGERRVQGEDISALSKLAGATLDPHRQAEVALRLASYHHKTGDYPAAGAAAQTAIAYAEKGQITDLTAAGYWQWGAALWAKGDVQMAQTQLEHALGLAQSAASATLEADCLHSLGQAAVDRGEYETARAHYEQAIRIFRQTGATRRKARTLGNIGIIYRNEGDYPAAQEYLEKALHAFRQIGDRTYEGIVSLNLGVVLWDQSNLQKARRYMEVACEISEKVSDLSGVGLALRNLGTLAAEQGEYATAYAYLQRALTVYQQTGEQKGEGITLQSMGNVQAAQGVAAATTTYQQALDIRRKMGDRRGEASCLRGWADAALTQFQFDQARAAYKEAYSIFQEIGDQRGEGEAIRGLGQVAAALGDFASARTFFAQALASFHSSRDEATILHRLGAICWQLGEYEESLAYAGQTLVTAVELNSLPFRATAQMLLGDSIAMQGKTEQAARYFREALALRRQMGQLYLATEPLAGLARVALAGNQPAEALTVAEEILSILGSERVADTAVFFRAYLICYQVLHAAADPRAQQTLTTAHDLLQEHAAKIHDEDSRRTFLENVASNREILAEFRKTA